MLFDFFFKDSTSHYAQMCVDTCPILFEVNRATSRAVIVFRYRNEKNLNEISSNQKVVLVLKKCQ